MRRIIEIDSPQRLEPFAADWRRIWAATPGANFFQSWEWLRLYWRDFAEKQRLRVFVVLQDGETLGLVPLVERNETTRLGGVRVLTYPLQDWGSFYGPIADDPIDVLGEVLLHLRREPRPRWDLLDLRWLRASQAPEVAAKFVAAGWSPRIGRWKTTSAIDLPKDWETYLAGRTAKLRSNVRRCRRRLTQQHQMQVESYRPVGEQAGPVDPRWDLYQAALTVAERSWQADSPSGTTLTHARIAPFLHACHAEAARLGMLDMHVLTLGDRPAAFAYNYHAAGEVTAMRTGYDRELRDLGVGMVMWSQLVERSIECGDSLIDLGPDSPEVKRGWSTRSLPVVRVTAYRSWKARLLQWKHRFSESGSATTQTRSVERRSR